ncbi:hypothetical protein RM844_08070 [Streptomyces sp. DSM 44915]|uniref:DUF11 domain-containing protein n=1 Tax=Streptomyces chisholmiae TaxID=3075540 RepID=A0ABU2JMN0_9ACTN|nr:hypothetical protein [Streptomyces sp. DSM 44915]MDT0266250.1 hypothetical protein [Streptomyces sp. DSM 44915]
MPVRRTATAVSALSAALLSATLLSAAPATAATAATIHPGADDSACRHWYNDGALDVRLENIPDPVVAGEWAEFDYRITNTLDVPVDGLVTLAEITAYDTLDGSDVPVTTEWFADGAWTPLTTRGWYDWFGTTDALQPGESATARLRVLVAADAPDWALGSAVIGGAHLTPQSCERTLTDLEFDIVEAS